VAGAAKSVQVRDELLDELGAHLHLANAGHRLGVGDAEGRAGRVAQTDVPDAQVAQLARTDPAAGQRVAHGAAPLVRARGSGPRRARWKLTVDLETPIAAAISVGRCSRASASACG
jgi:hypothetical protein